MARYTQKELINLDRRHDTLVGVDSDGCVFDTMETKQKQCFHGSFIAQWQLEPIERYVREVLEFVNLYSRSRGQNRFVTFLVSVDLLRERPEVMNSGTRIPAFTDLRKWVETEPVLSNETLAQAAATTGSEELGQVLAWSLETNRQVKEKIHGIPPFKHARACLEKMTARSDVIVVSATPEEALIREWEENKMTHLVPVIAGQELGKKDEHLALAAGGHYAKGRILMVGDAPGDLLAAHKAGALFYPINPGYEEASWQQLHEAAYDLFLDGGYTPAFEASLIADFEGYLPEDPPWKACRREGTAARPIKLS